MGLEQFVEEALDRYGRNCGPRASASSSIQGSLNNLFQGVVPRPPEAGDDTFLNSIFFTVGVAHPSAGASVPDFLQRLCINLRVRFPMSLVFTSQTLLQYSRLFRLIALVHYALQSVKRTWQMITRRTGG